jgi:arginyl-tRNA synthetase
LLLLKICEAISLRKDVEVANHSIESSDLQTKLQDTRLLAPHSILKRVKSETSVAAYSSAIALQLATESTQTPAEIADQILYFMNSSPSDSSGRETEKALLRDLTVSNTETGRLVFEFGDRAIATYLQKTLAQCLMQPIEIPHHPNCSPQRKSPQQSEIFLCQYSYARCTALIRINPLSNHIGKSVENDSAIWLKEGKLLLQKELNLLKQVITTLDEWEETSAPTLAIALSEAFQQFYRDCQIVKYNTVNLQLGQCRLALVMITHWLLKQLLEQGITNTCHPVVTFST